MQQRAWANSADFRVLVTHAYIYTERIILITHLKPLQPKTAITDDFHAYIYTYVYHTDTWAWKCSRMICMYVYVCMYVYICIHSHRGIHTWNNKHVHRAHAFGLIYLYVWVENTTHTPASKCHHIYIYIYVCVYLCVYILKHTRERTYAKITTWYVYIYIYTHT